MIAALFQLLALPARCAACNTWGTSLLCPECEAEVRPIVDPMCLRCGLPCERRVDRCRDCRDRQVSYDRARAAVAYAGPAREALKAFKLLGERRAARALAAWMAPVARDLGKADVIAWVPGTRRSEVERGFVPAEELARPLARSLGIRARPLLTKVRETRDQSGLNKQERRDNQRSAFAARPPIPDRVLLVDDVMTTGATVEACAEALKAGGARQVLIVTFARAL